MQQQTFGANDVQSGKTPFHTKCFHSGEETTKVMKSDDVPQGVRRSYFLYPWSMRACSITSCQQKRVFVSGCEMVPKVHQLMEVGHAISYTVHRQYGLEAPIRTPSIVYFLCLPFLRFLAGSSCNLVRDLFRKTIFLSQTLIFGDTLVKAPYPEQQQNSRATF